MALVSLALGSFTVCKTSNECLRLLRGMRSILMHTSVHILQIDVGRKVRLFYDDGKWYTGEIQRAVCLEAGTWHVSFDDGDDALYNPYQVDSLSLLFATFARILAW